jgi:hypothetical protein
MTVIGALSSFRELGKMSPHKRASVHEQDRSRVVAKPDSSSPLERGGPTADAATTDSFWHQFCHGRPTVAECRTRDSLCR